jgi:hypothetical protein
MALAMLKQAFGHWSHLSISMGRTRGHHWGEIEISAGTEGRAQVSALSPLLAELVLGC